ncbi:hypothetical protein MTBPR1_80160 [Candidatus Terasakiella magnetica]|uniref:Uncharacterized protein n=1 Tax=Candidatus Terasakiella magnetica TaxID=1867952 RepID=A0A1C3RLE7_9PROT|nr:hypothetical protein [Candidatus Terasakiella magnetica]SCA58106.1 hypothetical protein MTBPR1_80160 [Candidatus Terasakiella magnetica]
MFKLVRETSDGILERGTVEMSVYMPSELSEKFHAAFDNYWGDFNSGCADDSYGTYTTEFMIEPPEIKSFRRAWKEFKQSVKG